MGIVIQFQAFSDAMYSDSQDQDLTKIRAIMTPKLTVDFAALHSASAAISSSAAQARSESGRQRWEFDAAATTLLPGARAALGKALEEWDRDGARLVGKVEGFAGKLQSGAEQFQAQTVVHAQKINALSTTLDIPTILRPSQ